MSTSTSTSTSIAAAESSLRSIATAVITRTFSPPTATFTRTNGACSAVIALGTFRNASDLRDPMCSVSFKPEYLSIQSCCKDGAVVRVDDGCRQYCEVNNETAGFNCIEDLFEDYFGYDDETRSARRQTLCTEGRDNVLNDDGVSAGVLNAHSSVIVAVAVWFMLGIAYAL